MPYIPGQLTQSIIGAIENLRAALTPECLGVPPLFTGTKYA